MPVEVGFHFDSNVAGAAAYIDGTMVGYCNKLEYGWYVLGVGFYTDLGVHTVHLTKPGYKTVSCRSNASNPGGNYTTVQTYGNPVSLNIVRSSTSDYIFTMDSLSKTVNVTANVIKGYPAPSLDISIFADLVAIKSNHWDIVSKGESVSLSAEISAPGTHNVFAKAVMSNQFGSVEAESQHISVTV